MNTWNPDQTRQDQVGTSPLAVIRNKWWVIALTTAFAVGAAVVALSFVTPTYKATATLQVPIATGGPTPVDVTEVDRVMNTYAQLLQQRSLRTAVSQQLHEGRLPTLSTTIEANTELMQLSASAPTAALAQRTANVASRVLIARANALARGSAQVANGDITTQLNSLSASITSLRAQLAQVSPGDTSKQLAVQQSINAAVANYQALVVQRAQLSLTNAIHAQTLSVVQPAFTPTSPASPKWKTILALALALGLLGGVGLAFALERFSPRLYTVAAIEDAAGAEVIAAIPRVTDNQVYTAPLYNGGSPAQEAFSMLAIQVLAMARERQLHTILVTSRSKGAGKSTVAANLAAEMARSGHAVLLVEADMRAPSIHSFFELDPSVGFANLLDDVGQPPSAEQFVIRPAGFANLGVIPSGTGRSAPAQALASDRLGRVIEEMAASYEFVVFDAPPLVVSDPLSVARYADLVLLIAGGDAVTDRDIQVATRQLRSIGAKHVSLVVNRWRGSEPSYAYAYGDS
jgi:non-specific protein-tyrosine kinase